MTTTQQRTKHPASTGDRTRAQDYVPATTYEPQLGIQIPNIDIQRLRYVTERPTLDVSTPGTREQDEMVRINERLRTLGKR